MTEKEKLQELLKDLQDEKSSLTDREIDIDREIEETIDKLNALPMKYSRRLPIAGYCWGDKLTNRKPNYVNVTSDDETLMDKRLKAVVGSDSERNQIKLIAPRNWEYIIIAGRWDWDQGDE